MATATQIAEMILKDDPQLVEFHKNPQAVLKKKAKIDITAKQSTAIKRHIESYQETIDVFYPQAGKVVGKADWKKALKYFLLALAALLE